MDVRFIAVERAEQILPAILAAAKPVRPEAEAVVSAKF
jgi:hypothetical protein